MPLKFSHALNLSPLQYSFNLLSQLKARAMHTFDISLSLSLSLSYLAGSLTYPLAHESAHSRWSSNHHVLCSVPSSVSQKHYYYLFLTFSPSLRFMSGSKTPFLSLQKHTNYHSLTSSRQARALYISCTFCLTDVLSKSLLLSVFDLNFLLCPWQILSLSLSLSGDNTQKQFLMEIY